MDCDYVVLPLAVVLQSSYARANANVILQGMSLVDNIGARGSVIFLISSHVQIYQVRPDAAVSYHSGRKYKGRLVININTKRSLLSRPERYLLKHTRTAAALGGSL